MGIFFFCKSVIAISFLRGEGKHNNDSTGPVNDKIDTIS